MKHSLSQLHFYLHHNSVLHIFPHKHQQKMLSETEEHNIWHSVAMMDEHRNKFENIPKISTYWLFRFYYIYNDITSECFQSVCLVLAESWISQDTMNAYQTPIWLWQCINKKTCIHASGEIYTCTNTFSISSLKRQNMLTTLFHTEHNLKTR